MAKLEFSTVLYSDLNKNPASNSSSLAYNLESIKQSLDNLFSTPYGTRAWQPTYGHTLNDILGENMTQSTTNSIYLKAIESVERNEPRVQLDEANSIVKPLYEENKYQITLVFTIAGLSSQDKFAYDIKILNAKE